jgi:Zn-finger nucleic acid-binding protein
MKDSEQDIEFDIARGVWVARGCLDRSIAEEEEMVVVVEVILIVTECTMESFG